MPSIQAILLNKIFQSLPKDKLGREHDYAAEREVNASHNNKKPPKNLKVSPITFYGVDGELILPEKPNGKVIWYIHGGGFTTGSAAERRSITFYLAQKYGFTVIANNYRLSPENLWPVQLDDCMDFYRGILENYDPRNLYFMGESAGGTLVLAAALRARDEKMPLPAGIFAGSPVTDQYRDLPSHHEKAATDYMLGDSVSSAGQLKAVFGSETPGEVILKNPYTSPYYGDYTGLPPVFLAVSDYETLYDDSRYLFEKLKKEHHRTGLYTAHGVCHAYVMLPMMPEAKRTIAKWLDWSGITQS